MGAWTRFMTALNAGWQAYKRYEQAALSVVDPLVWDQYQYRLFRYDLLARYYDNTIFSELETYRAIHLSKSNRGLYKFTRSIYNPIGRLCDTYPGKVYGGVVDFENMTSGAIPLADVDDPQKNAIRQLWRWSNISQIKTILPLNGAMFGDTVIKLVDDRQRQQVRMEVLQPGLFKEVEFDAVGNVKTCVIEYPMIDKMGQTFTYTEVITKERFETFKNGSPFPIYQNMMGEDVVAWDNDYGFVPVVWIKHRNIGTKFGMAAGQKILGKVDELTSTVSSLHDNVRKAGLIALKATGIDRKKDSEALVVEDYKSNMPIIYVPKEGDINQLNLALDIPGALQAIQSLQEEIENDTPELALHRLRQGGNVTAPGIRAAFSDAVDLYQDARGNYDDGLIRAHQMGMTIGGIGGYRNFQSFTLNSYENGDLEHHIKERPVIDDTLSQFEKITFSIQSSVPNSIIWRELGYSETEINDAVTEASNRENTIVAAMAEAMRGANGTENQNPANTTPETTDQSNPEGQDRSAAQIVSAVA